MRWRRFFSFVIAISRCACEDLGIVCRKEQRVCWFRIERSCKGKAGQSPDSGTSDDDCPSKQLADSLT